MKRETACLLSLCLDLPVTLRLDQRANLWSFSSGSCSPSLLSGHPLTRLPLPLLPILNPDPNLTTPLFSSRSSNPELRTLHHRQLDNSVCVSSSHLAKHINSIGKAPLQSPKSPGPLRQRGPSLERKHTFLENTASRSRHPALEIYTCRLYKLVLRNCGSIDCPWGD